jgi:hypothetical protein
MSGQRTDIKIISGEMIYEEKTAPNNDKYYNIMGKSIMEGTVEFFHHTVTHYTVC